MDRYYLKIIAFVTGFSLMTYELAAARVLAPSIGSSIYVWTSVIGVIIASLALGFYAGGKLADARNRPSDLVWLLFAAAAGVIWTLGMYENVLGEIILLDADVRLMGVLAALILFTPTSFAIGMTSPYLAKLNILSLKTSGQHIASLDAMNSIGGIVGTFFAGFVMFGYIGSRQTFIVVICLLIAVSFLAVPSYRVNLRILLATVSLMASLVLLSSSLGAISIDSATANYQVQGYVYKNKSIVGLSTGPYGIQSAVYSDDDSLVFWYTNEMARLAIDVNPGRVLMLGGGAFTLPQYLAERLPEAQIDVVEIDPALEAISKKYFRYEDHENVDLIFADARTYLNTTQKKYDLVLVDVYGDSIIPPNMATTDYAKELDRVVVRDGVVVANIIGGETGACGDLLGALDSIYTAKFPNALYSTESDGDNLHRANYVAAYSKRKLEFVGMHKLSVNGTAYGDNFMPGERLFYDCRYS